MSTEYPGNAVPAPGYHRGNVSVNDELLASTAKFTQKGVTLAAGQGVLLLGTPLTRKSSDKRYYKAVVGTDAIVGLLRQTVDTGSVTKTTDPDVAEFQGNVVISGIVVASKAATASGGTAAALATAMGGGAKVIAAYDYLSF